MASRPPMNKPDGGKLHHGTLEKICISYLYVDKFGQIPIHKA
jgi:hypothetical protein